jgi:hypothetical protein
MAELFKDEYHCPFTCYVRGNVGGANSADDDSFGGDRGEGGQASFGLDADARRELRETQARARNNEINREIEQRAAASRADNARAEAARSISQAEAAQATRDMETTDNDEYGPLNAVASVFESVVSFFTGGIVNLEIDNQALIGEPLEQGVHFGIPGVGSFGPTVGLTETGPVVNAGLVFDQVMDVFGSSTEVKALDVPEKGGTGLIGRNDQYGPERGGSDREAVQSVSTPAPLAPTPAPPTVSNKGLLTQADQLQSEQEVQPNKGLLSRADQLTPRAGALTPAERFKYEGFA